MDDALTSVLADAAGVEYAVLFGSTARGTAHDGSDVDLAIGLAPGAEATPAWLGALTVRLEAAIGRDVDLTLLDEAGPALAWRVLRDGRTLKGERSPAFIARKARAIVEYLDWEPMERRFTEGALAAARRG